MSLLKANATIHVGKDEVIAPGEVFEIEESEVKRLTDRGFATLVDEQPPQPTRRRRGNRTE